RALTVREYARRHRPIHAEGWILRRVAVALAGEADEDAADFDVPGQRVVRRQLEVVAERRLAGGTVLLERFTGLIAEPQLVRIVLITGDRHQPIVAPAAEHVRAARQPGVEAHLESVVDRAVDARIDVDELLGIESGLRGIEVEERQRLSVA